MWRDIISNVEEYRVVMITTDNKKRVPKHLESKNNLRTFQAENREIFKNSQLQIKFNWFL